MKKVKFISGVCLGLLLASAAHAGLVADIKEMEGIIPSPTKAAQLESSCGDLQIKLDNASQKMAKAKTKKAKAAAKPAFSAEEKQELSSALKIIQSWDRDMGKYLEQQAEKADATSRAVLDIKAAHPHVIALGHCVELLATKGN